MLAPNGRPATISERASLAYEGKDGILRVLGGSGGPPFDWERDQYQTQLQEMGVVIIDGFYYDAEGRPEYRWNEPPEDRDTDFAVGGWERQKRGLA